MQIYIQKKGGHSYLEWLSKVGAYVSRVTPDIILILQKMKKISHSIDTSEYLKRLNYNELHSPADPFFIKRD